MVSAIILIDEKTEKGADEDPKYRLIQGGFGSDLMCLLMKQAEVKNQKDQDDKSENTKKDSLPIIVVPEKGEQEYVHH